MGHPAPTRNIVKCYNLIKKYYKENKGWLKVKEQEDGEEVASLDRVSSALES